VPELKAGGLGPSEIAKTLKIGRASVYRVLNKGACERRPRDTSKGVPIGKRVDMRRRLSSRRVLITGAASGIGRALATKGANEKMRLVLCDIEGDQIKLVADEVRRGPVAGRGHIDFARIGFRVSDELRDSLGWYRWMYHHDVGTDAYARDRRNVADEIVIKV
jgi:short chain dehydrogenase